MRTADIDLAAFGGYQELIDDFAWDIPERVNIAAEILDSGVSGDSLAIIVERADGDTERWTFDELREMTGRYAAFLATLGVTRGDRVALVMPQGPELAALHLAVYSIGAIALPMSMLYGPQTFHHILGNSEAVAVVIDEALVDRVRAVRDELATLRYLVVRGDAGPDEHRLAAASECEPNHDRVDTAATDPALLLYTSGSTGHPKGALHGHQILEGYILTFRLFFNLSLDDDTVLYTPSDWAWVGGLLDILLPGLALGHTVLADEARFSGERSIELMAQHRVTHAFLTPTALKMFAQLPIPANSLALGVIASGGEAVSDEVHRWSREELGATINEFYGLTEVNHLIGGCAALWDDKPGWMGRPYPGRRVDLITPDGMSAAPGEVGEIVVEVGDPTQMLHYWNNPEATAARVRDGWISTGDQALRDIDGYVRFLGRDDDMIASAGYRIGPAEVEECLLRHPSVAEVGVIATPDDIRGQVVTAVIQTAGGVEPSEALADDLQNYVKAQLAAYKYPRVIEFVDELPKTTTGKINRRLLTDQRSETS